MTLGLRARSAIAFALLALVVSTLLAVLTYGIARNYLVHQRETLVVHQSLHNAASLDAALRAADVDVVDALANLANAGDSRGIAHVNGGWYSASVPVDTPPIPAGLVDGTRASRAVRQRIAIDGVPTLVVGVELSSVSGEYFTVTRLSDLQRTLAVLGWILAGTAAFTVIVGALLGLYASRRVLRPLHVVSDAAEHIARGHLETRLELSADPDLAGLGSAFNDMAETLEQRSDRDARFASDVSHELRNPLTALTTAVDVLDARADERTRPAVDVVRKEVDHFRQLVLDLLELARLDSRGPQLVLDEVDPRTYFPSQIAELAGSDVPVAIDASVPPTMMLDKRRVERVLANFVDNAERHGGGLTRVEISAGAGIVQVAVEDRGPGVPVDEREQVFDRFRRGTRGTGERGTGLGLAIVAEHCRIHGGRAWVESPRDRDCGARFVATFACGDEP